MYFPLLFRYQFGQLFQVSGPTSNLVTRAGAASR